MYAADNSSHEQTTYAPESRHSTMDTEFDIRIYAGLLFDNQAVVQILYVNLLKISLGFFLSSS